MRKPAVADRFYPGSPEELKKTISDLLLKAGSGRKKKKAIAAISPHAGYIYSGELAAETLDSIVIPETVVVIGPNHHGTGAPVSLSTCPWMLPFGTVPVNEELAEHILHYSSNITRDEKAHRLEHSIEVQIPFLQYRQRNLSLVPLVVSHISYPLCIEIAEAVVDGIKTCKNEVLLLASTDMSHYVPRHVATEKDAQALRHIKNLDPEKLYFTVFDHKISMCGVIPVAITLIAAKMLGASSCELIGYTDSGYVSGDTKQVVGYAGLTVH
ncbi:AmmeMemoRadiSam system protein B [Desulfomarina sp.]